MNAAVKEVKIGICDDERSTREMPDIFLLDIQMQGKSGIEAAEKIEKSECENGKPNTPKFLVTIGEHILL